ncbi:translin-associated protein X isoform X2 [Octopus bimaculoides]|uniref:translin-associated protein X isoform X2 n=1 Tax=Octopus bimaculoides TaxID=37653 RepID=UPI0022DF6558|nr:translin-associated protein X isoform X2 [Octopus bimaculoides]
MAEAYWQRKYCEASKLCKLNRIIKRIRANNSVSPFCVENTMAANPHVLTLKEQNEKNSKSTPESASTTDIDSDLLENFRTYQVKIDARHDKYERIVKLGRDITIESKRIIFLLHRNSSGDNENILGQTDTKFKELLRTKFLPLAKELEAEDPYQYIKAYTFGVQEFIEAVSFYFYIKENRLVTLNEIQSMLNFKKIQNNSSEEDETDNYENEYLVFVRPVDFLLGVADLTGELMRMAIKSISGGDVETPFRICNFLREIHTNFLGFGNTCRETSLKMLTMKQSLEKVETACYMMKVRGSEVPKHAIVDVLHSADRENTHFSTDTYG